MTAADTGRAGPSGAQVHTFQVDLHGVVDLLSEHLYPGPDVYVRELLQNAVDAVTARRLRHPGHRGAVELQVHAATGTLMVGDDGIGLTETEVHELLATIGRSSKRAMAGEAYRPATFIGRFGIGLLACFLVADEITVVTRSAADPAAPAVRWRGRPDGTYDLAVLDTPVLPGTRVYLNARPGREHLLAPARVLGLARHYGSLLPVSVTFIDGATTHAVTGGTPPWAHLGSSLEQQRAAAVDYARQAFDVAPLDVVPLRADGVRGLAFVLPFEPSPSARQAHRVYLRRMLLTESADRLLPDWAFFVRCVVDVDDLQPNAARDALREDERLLAVRDQLGRCLRDHLVDLAGSHPDRLEAIVAVHHRGITALAVHDDDCLRLFADWLPVQTSLGEMTLGEQSRRFGGEIRYVRRVDDFRQVAPLAAAQGRCVVNAGYVHTAELLGRLGELGLRRDVAELDVTDMVDTFAELTAPQRAEVHDLLRVAEEVVRPLGCAAEVRAYAPEDLPVVYLCNDGGRFRRQLDHTRDLLARSPAESSWAGLLGALSTEPPVRPEARLCLNLRSPLVRSLAAQARDAGSVPRVRGALQLLYVQALLLGHHPLRRPEFALFNDAVQGLVHPGTPS